MQISNPNPVIVKTTVIEPSEPASAKDVEAVVMKVADTTIYHCGP